jgi:mannose-1-phosphate guanylyltransferase/mannose-6-phosphate isomerase
MTAFRIAKEDPEGMLAVFPADHVILHPDILLRAVDFGMELAREHDVVDIGVPPGHPETGYGYIELGDVITSRGGLDAHRVKRFVEKPSLERAQEYLQAGNYMWNSGMFVWQARRFLEQLRTHLPQTYEALDAAFKDGSVGALQRAYEGIQDISVDYAIMENVSDVVAIPADFGWRDIGDWNALYELMDHDGDGNASEGPSVTLDTRNSGFLAPQKLVASIGVEDLIVVDTPDVLLLVRRDRTQDVKKLLDELKNRGDEDLL